MKYLLIPLLSLLPLTAHAGSTQAFEQANQRMHQGMNIAYTGDVDTDFLRGMIPHHQGAVDMSRVTLDYGSDAEAKALAEWIIYIQEIEMAQMRHLLTRIGLKKGTKAGIYKETAVQEFTGQMHEMHQNMAIDFSGDADADMILGMIPHHQAAIDMAFTQLQYGQNPEVKAIARGIIIAQQSEIAYMQRWLKRKGIAEHVTNGEQAAKHQHIHHHH